MLVAIRAVHFAAVLLLFGGFVFVAFVVRPACREASAASQARALDRALLTAAAITVGIALVSGSLWLASAASEMSGLPWHEAWSRNVVTSVLDATWFGQVWKVRFAIALVLAIVIAAGWHRSRSPNRFGALALFGLLAGLLLSTLALTGHAAGMGGTTRAVAVTADALHLLAAGAWIGALPPFVLLLKRSARATMPLSLIGATARRMSALGIVSVACLVATGLIGGAYLLGGVAGLLGTPYGRLLTVKLGLFALMLGFAAVNRRHWTPMFEAASATANAGVAQAALRGLTRNAIRETLLAFAIVSIVGALGTVSPGAHEELVWPLPFTLAWPDRSYPGSGQVAIAVAGFAAAAVVFFVLTRRGVARVHASAVGIGIAVIAALSLCAVPANPATYSRSPIRYTATSIARGSALYTQRCATCHGADGYGDGPAAAALPVKPAPLTKRLLSRREGDLFWLLSNGVAGTEMPGFAASIGESHRWDIVNFLLAQADAEAAKTMDGSVEPWRGIVAPDFTFEMERGSQETLNQQRGRSHVLIVLFSHPQSTSRLCILAGAKDALARGGVRVVAVPTNRQSMIDIDRHADPRCGQSVIAAGPDSDIVAAYTLFRRIPPRVVPPVPAHSEFLVDRQGYLRARWIPQQDYVWDGHDDLLRQVLTMDRKDARPEAPERPVAGFELH